MCVPVREPAMWCCRCHFKPVTDYTQKTATGGVKETWTEMLRHVWMKSFRNLPWFAITAMDSEMGEKLFPNSTSPTITFLSLFVGLSKLEVRNEGKPGIPLWRTEQRTPRSRGKTLKKEAGETETECGTGDQQGRKQGVPLFQTQPWEEHNSHSDW